MSDILFDRLNLTRPLILFDLETTTPEPATARIVQLAMKVYNPDRTVKQYQSLVNPGIAIPPSSSEIHKITDDIIRTGCAACWKPEAEHPSEVCATFRPVPTFRAMAQNLFKGFSAADFAGYNVRFDLRVIANEFSRASIQFDYSNALVLDGFRLWQILEPRSLSDAIEYWAKKTLDNAHNAMDDILATEDVIIAQLVRAGERLPATFKEIHELCYPKDSTWIDSEGKFAWVDGRPCLNFGKHKGKSMQECRSYLQWMIGADFSVEVKRIAEQAVNGVYPTR